MDRDEAESVLTNLKKFYDHLKDRRVNVSQAPRESDDSSTMFWTVVKAIRNIWHETENYMGAELRGTKLLTSIWSHASDVCNGKVDVLDYDNKVAFGTESGLSAEMTQCVEEARHAVTTFVQLKKELEQMKKERASRLAARATSQNEEEKEKMKHVIETSLKKAMDLHETVLSCPFEETPDIKVKLHEKCNGNELIYSIFLAGNIIKRCNDKLHEQHSTLLKDTCSHGSNADLHTKAPNTCTDMDIDNDDQMPLVSSKRDQNIKEVEVILCKALQSCSVDAGELQEMSLMRLAEEIDHKVIELNQRNRSLDEELEKQRSDIGRLKDVNSNLVSRLDAKDDLLKDKTKDFEELQKENKNYLSRLDAQDDLFKAKTKENEELKKENENYLSRLDVKDDLMKAKTKEFEELRKENENYLSRLDAKDDLLNAKTKEIEESKKENENFLSRLSQYTSAQLTHDNPNVADLSDSNRPTKVAERFSELYDNEWTDAFGVINGRYRYTEEKAISSLLYILTQAYEFCLNSSKEQDQQLDRVLERNYSSSNTAQKHDLDPKTELSSLEKNVIHNLKKRNIESSAKSVKEDFLKQLQKSDLILSDFDEPHVKAYALSCAHICWQMVLHSPPLIIESSYRPEDKFSIIKYKYYKSRGTKYKYIVWPVLYLHMEGAILSKGVAEAD